MVRQRLRKSGMRGFVNTHMRVTLYGQTHLFIVFGICVWEVEFYILVMKCRKIPYFNYVLDTNSFLISGGDFDFLKLLPVNLFHLTLQNPADKAV